MKLETVCEILAGYGFPLSFQGKVAGEIPFFKVGDISEAWKRKQIFLRQAQHYLTEEEAKKIRAMPFPPNTTVFAKIGAAIALNRRAMLSEPALVDNNVMGLHPKTQLLDPHYLFYWTWVLKLQEFSRATTVPSIRKSDVSKIKIPLPPLAEQKRIVSELEKQLTRLDAAERHLLRMRSNLRRYRASVLKAGCEGRLVPTEAELTRAEGRGYETAEDFLYTKSKELSSKSRRQKRPTRSNKPRAELPEGWFWTTMPELGELSRGKSKHRPRNDPSLFGGDYPFIQTGDVRSSGGWIRNFASTYNEAGLAQSHLWPAGTLCITIAANIAETGILTFSACFPDSVVGFLFDGDPVVVRYMELFLRTAKADLERLAPATAQKNINLDTLSELMIAIPPLAEMRRIVAEVDRRLSIATEVESAIKANLERGTGLRLGILRRAFHGELVAQNSQDEPAGVLLERIRKTRSPVNRAAGGAMNCAPTTGRGTSKSQPRQRRPGATSLSGDSALQSGIEVQETGSAPRVVVGAQFIAPPAAVTEPDSGKPPFVEHGVSEQMELAWEFLFGRGLFEKEDAVREIAQGLREQELAHFQRLRQGGPLFNEIASTLDRGVRQGFFDRPKRGYVRAVLSDPKTYSPAHWRLCLLGALDGEPVEEKDALCAAAEWARENMGLEFARLREDGVILRGLRAALKEAVKRGEITRRRNKVFRSTTVKAPS